MGIVIKQSIKNTIITYIGFGIGAINTLFMYRQFLVTPFMVWSDLFCRQPIL